jgi:hypothetical protein
MIRRAEENRGQGDIIVPQGHGNRGGGIPAVNQVMIHVIDFIGLPLGNGGAVGRRRAAVKNVIHHEEPGHTAGLVDTNRRAGAAVTDQISLFTTRIV